MYELISPLTAAHVYIRLTQPMRSLPPAYIYAFPKYDPLHCAAIKKTAPTVLECHKMTLRVFEKDFIISEKRDRTEVFSGAERFRLNYETRINKHDLLHIYQGREIGFKGGGSTAELSVFLGLPVIISWSPESIPLIPEVAVNTHGWLLYRFATEDLLRLGLGQGPTQLSASPGVRRNVTPGS
ncbi:hypothetical protein CEXT_560201 [Caerostris extrusa]|uniref:Uncharacterized protein n=1 Tax=Caerostris extrusa TaxID=172846 RepID=A0AAV4MK19_CAEEX|nr:hypothetical protein CEXT_560201 [Caerostris extrusa]